MHDFDLILIFFFFEQDLFIIDLINNLGLKLINFINWGLNFPTLLLIFITYAHDIIVN